MIKTVNINKLMRKNNIFKDMVKYLQDLMGKDTKAIIGISGGKDSTICAAVCTAALGKDNVIGVLMPNGFQRDISDAKEICRILNINNIEINIESTYLSILKEISRIISLSKTYEGDSFGLSCINSCYLIRLATWIMDPIGFNSYF